MPIKKWLKKFIPSTKSLKKSPQLKWFKSFFKDSKYMSRDHQTMARGVAAGLAGCVIPGFQIFYAAILAILIRGNLPLALLFTLVTNPLTVVPITYFIYFVGSLIVGNGKNIEVQEFHWDFSSFHAFWSNMSGWLLQLGKGYLVGLPIVSLGLGILGYFGSLLVWKTYTYFSHKKKK